MRTRAVVIACIIAAASVLLAWATTPAGPRGVAPPPPAPDTFAIGFDVPSVRTLAVTAAGLDASIAGGPDWTITLPSAGDGGPATWPANPEAVRVLLTELATQSIEEASHSDTADPLATITIFGSTDDQPTTIEVLGPPLAGLLPIRITDQAVRDGFVPANRFRPTDAGQLAALADPRVFDLPGVITRLSITPANAKTVTIERAGGVWSLPLQAGSLDPGPRLHQPTVDATIGDLRHVRASNVIVPLDESSLTGEAFLSIEATADQPRQPGTPRQTVSARLTIMGQSTVDGAYDAMATRSSNDNAHRLQIRLDPQAFPVLPADINTLLDPVPLPFAPGDAAIVELISVLQHVALTRSIDGWTGCHMNPNSPGSHERTLDLDGVTALRLILSTLATPAARVRLRTNLEGAVGYTLKAEPLSGTAPVELLLAPKDPTRPFTVFDATTAWEYDLDDDTHRALLEAWKRASTL